MNPRHAQEPRAKSDWWHHVGSLGQDFCPRIHSAAPLVLRHQGALGTTSASRRSLLLWFSVARGVVMTDPDGLGVDEAPAAWQANPKQEKWQSGVPNSPSEGSGEARKRAGTHL